MVKSAAWLCAWLLMAAHAAAQAELVIEAPPALTLGEQSQVTLRYRAPAALHAKLWVSIGTLGEAQQLSDGSWVTQYTPPSTRYPQVAIVALVSERGDRVTWARIALRGTATVELRSDPHVSVRVRVADTEFGPVLTDDSGRAALAVVVPPGVEQAVSRAVDELGNERKETISLGVPPITPLLCVCPTQAAHDFLVFAARPDSTPAQAATFSTQASAITETSRVEEQPGVYRVAFELPAGSTAAAAVRVSVAEQAAGPAAHSCELSLSPAPPESLPAPPLTAAAPKPPRPVMRGELTVGLSAGYVTNFARVSAPLITAQLGYRVPWLQRRLRLSVLAGYYQSISSHVPDLDARLELWAVPLQLRADYTITLGRFELAPVLAAGALSLSSQLASSATGRVREWSLLPMWAASARAATRLGPGRIALELGYWWASASAGVVSGNAAGAVLTLGYELVL